MAYYVSLDELEVDELRGYLLEDLPNHMVPSYFVHLSELPLNSNAKLDIDSLPEPKIKTSNNYVAPNPLPKSIYW